ncbi:GTP cyclohydrolase I FolE [Brachybacterium halotolerans subsp. kimchii]|uniref:GTP cyclohydrolase 1 n=1 Tax=Brachybacterium halotolerans TaxID=2795215 RepID=A0ABS1BFM8_9MICO|nr:GTP cyclohydrolase I FolE [Brachybacterium halotolerans]MBK0332982.1 GTP cyclohydrolase I FolE [Brachybacterium halotolerans]UEJ83487.1 GTP cyclohydrolase I FolE [Brachybacterium halotolerans subsp. kimchii]
MDEELAPEESGAPGVDAPRIEAAVREILAAIGEDPDRDGLVQTPSRVARMYAEVFEGMRMDAHEPLSVTFGDIEHQELVLVRDIRFHSMCEHHLLPFFGTAHVGYIPGARGVTGLSKIARLVHVYARRPQVQERITTQIADALMEELRAAGAIVVLEASHMCMSMRGVRAEGAQTVTSAVRGILRKGTTRSEAMSLIMRG